MRIAVICKIGTANSHYRAILPLRELERRGHTIFWPGHASFKLLERGGIPNWDALHIHQFIGPDDLQTVERLRAGGVAVVWDTDDDISAPPKGTDSYKRLGGRRKIKQHFQRSVEMASAAHLMTTTNAHLGQVYRDAGVEHVAVIENHLAPRDPEGGRRRHQGVVIGMTLAGEHVHDLRQLRIPKVLQRVMDTHPNVRVVAIGLDLELRDPRYTHLARKLPIDQLIDAERIFDIGIAPLIDLPMNRSRSNVKLKEYGAAGAAWLASPVGPYVGLGEAQGGLLVGEDDWFTALDTLVRDGERRRELAQRAHAWARRQTVQHAGKAWETAFRSAIVRARSRRLAA